jgi:hypothetical protein
MTRRDQCYLVGKRAARLKRRQAATAWLQLAYMLQEMGELDIPKYRHLIRAIRRATILHART